MKIPDLKDLRLEVQVEFQQIVRSFVVDLTEPLMLNAIAMQWITLPNEQKEMIREQMPKTYAKLQSIVK